MVCPAVLYFWYRITQNVYQKCVYLPEMCLRIVSTNLSETVLTSWRIRQDIITENLRSSCKLPGKNEVKVTLVQALRLCTGRTAHRGSRGIALLFHDHGTRRGRGQRYAPAALYPQERPGTHCTGGWVGPRAGLDRCGKSRPHRDSIPGPSRP